jgi:putative heme iron utilization protein
VIGGLAADRGDPARPDALIEELAENLRAILRDMLCGHLDADLVSVADELLSEAADAPEVDASDPAAGVR